MAGMETFVCRTAEETKMLAAEIGRSVKGGEVFAFHSDLGGGKTTFVKGLAEGMGVKDVVQSPTFTLSQIHKAAHGLELHHFDFYRLNDAGVMRAELAESLTQPGAVVAIEWGEIVHDILPADVIDIKLAMQDDDSRVISIGLPPKHHQLLKTLQNYKQNRKLA